MAKWLNARFPFQGSLVQKTWWLEGTHSLLSKVDQMSPTDSWGLSGLQ